MPEYMNGIWYLSLLTVGTGYLAGRGGFFFVVGGYVCYWLLAPILSLQGKLPTAETLAGTDLPTWLRISLFRPVGIGMLVGGALTGILLALPLVLSAIRSMQTAAKMKSPLSRDEMPIRLLYWGVGGAFVLMLVMASLSVDEMGLARGLTMALLGTLWIWVAGVVLSECIGRTNWSPLSGMTLIGVTILIFVASGMSDRATVVAAVMVGAAMCVAMAQATDLMLDLKTGYLVGAVPRKQQIAQFLGTWLGPILVMGLILVLHKAYGMGSEQLPAPQGQALASVIEGILGGDVPVQKYLAGAGLGALLSASGIGGLGILGRPRFLPAVQYRPHLYDRDLGAAVHRLAPRPGVRRERRCAGGGGADRRRSAGRCRILPGEGTRFGDDEIDMKHSGQAVIWIAFLIGAYLAVQDTAVVDWPPFVATLALGAVGVALVTFSRQREASHEERRAVGIETLTTSLQTLVEKVDHLVAEKDSIDVYDFRHRVDDELLEHLDTFAESRESLTHAYGLQAYADVMSPVRGWRALPQSCLVGIDRWLHRRGAQEPRQGPGAVARFARASRRGARQGAHASRRRRSRRIPR